jgi:[acyl-carrier-protein] S-malonyltransferase
MSKDFYDNFACAKQVFEEADDALGFSISKLCFEGPEDQLRLTMNTQPAILTCSVAALAVLRENGLNCTIAGGHSLGEYSALVAAGVLSLADAVRAVRKRGQFMQEAVPVGEGAMSARRWKKKAAKPSRPSTSTAPARSSSPVPPPR